MSQKPEFARSFYGDVDRARYRANWSCLIWFFIVGLIVVGVGWAILRRSGLL